MNKHRKVPIWGTTILALVASVIGLGFVSPAGAATPSSSSGSDDGYTFSLNYDLSSADSAGTKYSYAHTSTVKSLTNPQGKVMGMPVGHPSAHWQKAFAKKCPTFQTYPSKARLNKLRPTTWVIKRSQLHRFRKAAMTDKVVKRLPHRKVKVSATCFFVVKGKIPDTIKRVDGQIKGWSHAINRRDGKMLFELVTVRSGGKVAKVPVRRGQAKNGSTFSIGDCGNKKAAVITYQQNQVAYGNFSSYYWHDQGVAYASIHVGGSGTISYGSCSFTYFLDMSVEGKAAFNVLVSGKTATQARGNATKVINKQSAYTNASANVETNVKAQLEGKFSKEGCTTPPPPPPAQPKYSCDQLLVTKGDHQVTVNTFKTSQDNATFTKADISWGDGTSTTSASPVGLTHTYGADGTYTIKATAHFDVNGTDKTATSSGCQQAVTFTTPPPPQNKPPTGEIVKYPQHLYEGGEFMVEVVGSDPEDGANVDLSYSVTGPVDKIVDADHPEHCDAEGVNQMCTFYIKAKQTTGTGTVSLTVTDSKGLHWSDSKSFPVLEPQL